MNENRLFFAINSCMGLWSGQFCLWSGHELIAVCCSCIQVYGTTSLPLILKCTPGKQKCWKSCIQIQIHKKKSLSVQIVKKNTMPHPSFLARLRSTAKIKIQAWNCLSTVLLRKMICKCSSKPSLWFSVLKTGWSSNIRQQRVWIGNASWQEQYEAWLAARGARGECLQGLTSLHHSLYFLPWTDLREALEAPGLLWAIQGFCRCWTQQLWNSSD